eukprot:358538-Chlamydomonas_euryale.AAC.2
MTVARLLRDGVGARGVGGAGYSSAPATTPALLLLLLSSMAMVPFLYTEACIIPAYRLKWLTLDNLVDVVMYTQQARAERCHLLGGEVLRAARCREWGSVALGEVLRTGRHCARVVSGLCGGHETTHRRVVEWRWFGGHAMARTEP